MDTNNRTVKTINEFIDWTKQFSNGQHLFRGVSKESYKLEAAANRRLPESHRNNPKKLLNINKDLITKAKSLGHDEKNGRELSDLEILAELQHFGAATCLIDFSRSALIALWFACQTSSTFKTNSGREANGKVYAIHNDDKVRLKPVTPKLVQNDIDFFLEPDENNRYLLYQWQPKIQNNRIIAQQSVFVFGGDQIEVKDVCIIDMESKQAILTSLEKTSGITEDSIFPDFDGFSRLHAHNKPYIEPDAQKYLQLGLDAYQKHNFGEAIDYFTEVINLDPADTSIVTHAYYNRGVAYNEKGQIDRAIENYNITLRLDPSSADAYNNRGYAYFQQEDYDKALQDYNSAIEIKPDNVLFYNNRSMLLLHLQEWENAKSDLTKLKNMGQDINVLFRNACTSIADYEQKYGVKLPQDIAEMLTAT